MSNNVIGRERFARGPSLELAYADHLEAMWDDFDSRGRITQGEVPMVIAVLSTMSIAFEVSGQTTTAKYIRQQAQRVQNNWRLALDVITETYDHLHE